ADSLEEFDGLGDALQVELAHLNQAEAIRGHCSGEVLSNEYLPCSRLRCDPGSDVHGAPKVVAFVVDHRPSVHADVRWWEPARKDVLDDLEGCAHGIPGIAEMKMHPVTEHLHALASMPRADLAHELCERQGNLGRPIVPRLFGEFWLPR